jgi:hypothetical protein
VADQDAARDRAVRELACWLGPVTTLRDPEAGARKFMDWLQANHWRYVAPPPGWKADPPNPEATARGVDLARDLLNIRKDHDHASD